MDSLDEEQQRQAQRQHNGQKPLSDDGTDEVSAYRLVLTHLNQPPSVDVPADFAGQVMNRINSRQAIWREWLFYGSVIATMLISTLLGVALADNVDRTIVTISTEVLKQSGCWIAFGLVCFTIIQWLDGRAYGKG